MKLRYSWSQEGGLLAGLGYRQPLIKEWKEKKSLGNHQQGTWDMN
jgi:hypothetical protein